MALQIVGVSYRPSASRTEAGSGPVAEFVTAFSPRLAAVVVAMPPAQGDIAEIGPQPNSGSPHGRYPRITAQCSRSGRSSCGGSDKFAANVGDDDDGCMTSPPAGAVASIARAWSR